MSTTITSPAPVVYPQSPDLPQPLVIHPSIDPELAKGLIAAVEYINDHPAEFDMTMPFGPKGCIICHAERLSTWSRYNTDHCSRILDDGTIVAYPLGDYRRIFWPAQWTPFGAETWLTNAGRTIRIEHFLRTGE